MLFARFTSLGFGMTVRAHGLSYKGRVRRRNEDAIRVNESRGIYIISDGMGGQKAGHVASNVAVDEAIHALQALPEDHAFDLSDLEIALRNANDAVLDLSTNFDELEGMGCTMVILSVRESEAKYCHCGDSRAYLLRNGQLNQITVDHTLAERKMRLGVLSEQEAKHSPDQHVLVQALGVESDEIKPDVGVVMLEPGDMLLLCSDGLSGFVDESEIVSVLAAYRSDLGTAVRVLIQSAERARSTDNITVLLVEYAE